MTPTKRGKLTDASAQDRSGPFKRDDFLNGQRDEAGLYWDEFCNSLCQFTCLQPGPLTVRDAAKAWNVTEQTIREAVEDHYWLSLEGPDDKPSNQTIYAEGE